MEVRVYIIITQYSCRVNVTDNTGRGQLTLTDQPKQSSAISVI